MKSRPHVLVIFNSLDYTGAFKSIFNYMTRLKDEVQFSAVLPEGSTLKPYFANENIPVHFLPFIDRNWRKILSYFPRLHKNADRLSKICRAENIDLIHLNNFYNLVPFVAKKKGLDLPIVSHIRDLPRNFPAWIYKVWLSQNFGGAEKVFAVSETLAKDLPKKSKKLEVLFDILSKEPAPIERKVDAAKIRLFYPANYFPSKGQEHAIKALKLALAEVPNLYLRFAGSHFEMPKAIAYLQNLKLLAEKEKISDHILFDGFESDIQAAFTGTDIVLNFSDIESFSMVNLEALQSGMALISSDSGGPRELFEHNKSGKLVPVGDIKAMAEAIIELANDEKLRHSFGEAGRDFAGKKFNAAAHSNRLRDIYYSLTKIDAKT